MQEIWQGVCYVPGAAVDPEAPSIIYSAEEKPGIVPSTSEFISYSTFPDLLLDQK